MLNIHSFLQGAKKNMTKTNVRCYKSCLMVSAFTMVGFIFVISSDDLMGKSGHHAETYVKAQSIKGVFEESIEETAYGANILLADDNEEYLLTNQKEQNIKSYSMIAISSMVTKAIGVAEEAQVEALEQRIAEEKEKEEKEKAEKEAKEKEEQEKKEAEAKAKAKAKKKAAAEKKAKEQKEKESKKISLPKSQTEVLQRIVEAEATGEDMKGKILVANVIMNRVNSKSFPNTVKEVVFQKNGSAVQFSPTADGRYWSVKVSKDSIEAVKRALGGEDYSKGALYFSARSKADKRSMSWFDRNLTWLFKHGGHEFYK